MASWTQTFSLNNKYSLTLECSEQSHSVANNTSVVAYKLTMATAANSYVGYSDYLTTISVSIDGTVVYSYNAARNFNAPTVKSSYSEVLASGTRTVAHDDETGAKTCACAATVTVASGDYSPGSASISQNLPLTTIPRASTASWSGDFVIGTGKAIAITRASSSFTHKLTFTLGSRSETPTSSAGTSYTWTPTAANWAAQFPTQTSRTGTLTLYTYNGSTLIGSNTYTFTLKIPDSWKPTAALSLAPFSEKAFIAGTGKYVQGYSAIAATATASRQTGDTAAIVSYTFSGSFSKTVQTSAASTTQTSGIIATSGSKSVTVTVTDARGRTGTATATCTFVSYAFPAVSSLSYARGIYSGGSWTASDSGEDLRIIFSATCSLSGDGNAMTYSVPVMGGATGSITSGQSVTLYRTGIGTVTAYTVTVTVTDSVGNSASRSIFVPTVEIPFVLDPQLPAIGVGAVPQTARTLELASNWFLNIGAGVTLPYTTDILATAEAQVSGTMKVYRGAGNTYTGTVPSSYFGYGTFLVMRRAMNSINVLALSSHTYDGIALNFFDGSSWSGWQTVIPPTEKNATANTSLSFTLANNTRALITTICYNTAADTQYIVNVDTYGNVTYTGVKTSSSVTVTTSTRTFTLRNGTTSNMFAFAQVFAGSAT